jgi:hypothetical protein
MQFEYYYNNVPKKGLCRNNLIYTSLISKDRKTFCQWYYNDEVYHQGQNEVVDEDLMVEKWSREIKFLTQMSENFPNLIPKIEEIDYKERKIFLQIEDNDFWEKSNHSFYNFLNVLPDWEDQMLKIFRAHRDLGIYKYSLHPSSYFIVRGELKSINYFFCYDSHEKDLRLQEVFSHISSDRLKKLYPLMKSLDIDPQECTALSKIQELAFETFKSDFPVTTMEKAKKIYNV